jgi:hypothetical protein
MIRRPALAALALLLALSSSALELRAQRVSGRLLDGETKRPLPGGTLYLFTEEGETVAESTSAEDGSFVLEAPDRGSYYLAAELAGYADVSEGLFDLGRGGELEVEVYMRPSPVELDGIDVRTRLIRQRQEVRLEMVGYRTREQQGYGWFFDPERLRKARPNQASELIRMVPRISVAQGFGTPITMDCGAYAGFIDGLNVWSGTAWEMDFFVEASDIAAMEIYTSLAQLPVEFRKGGNCGAIVVWTKG